ncbi:MAG: FecR domain-containing protein, partial [Spirochaetaceae bacterium]|nr:FecR domain-containing protein [Spirochaetaceae bacterium]
METTDIQEDGSPKRGGILKGFFLSVLIIILALLLLTVLVVLLTGPEGKQLKRLEEIHTATDAAGVLPEMKGGGAVVDIPEAALSGILSSNVTPLITEIPDVEFLGLDISLYDEVVDVLMGAEGKVPRLNIRRKVVLGVRARIGMTVDGWLSVSPESVRIGRLPLPIGRIFKLIRRNPEYASHVVKLDPEENRFLIDPEVWLSGMIPGMTVKSVRAVRGSLRIAVGIPAGIEEGLKSIIAAASREEETLMRNLNEILPSGDRAILESVSGLFAAVREHSAKDTESFNGATVSYLEGRVDARWPGNDNIVPVDFGDKLPVGTRISCGKESFAELLFTGDHIIKISENSEMTVDSTAGGAGSDTFLSLFAGKARALVSPLSDGEGFRLTARQTAMAVRGTDFAVSLSGRDQVDLAVLEGLVAVNDKVVAGTHQA